MARRKDWGALEELVRCDDGVETPECPADRSEMNRRVHAACGGSNQAKRVKFDDYNRLQKFLTNWKRNVQIHEIWPLVYRRYVQDGGGYWHEMPFEALRHAVESGGIVGEELEKIRYSVKEEVEGDRRVEEAAERVKVAEHRRWSDLRSLAPDKMVDEFTSIRWINQHLGYSMDEISAEDCPSRGTLDWWYEARKNAPSFRSTFTLKVLPSKAEQEYSRRMSSDGSGLVDRIHRMGVELCGPDRWDVDSDHYEGVLDEQRQEIDDEQPVEVGQ